MKEYSLGYFAGEKINNEVINETERLLNVKFPDDYRNLVLEHDGCSLIFEDKEGDYLGAYINVRVWGLVGIKFKRHRIIEMEDESEIYSSYGYNKEELPDSVIPFAYDGGGNNFLFDFNEDENNPKIYFHDHEESVISDDLEEEDLERMSVEEWQRAGMIFVADSFSEFMSKVQIDEEDLLECK